MAAADNGPSGSDKGHIYRVLAKLIFMDHIKYGPAYSVNSKKFHDVVCNRIRTLRGKYKKIKASFSSTGAGVMSVEGTSANNLLDAALLELPWYTELDAIWHSNPSMAAKVHSSRPETVKLWGVMQNTIGHITQHVDALVDNMQHHSVVRVSYIPNAPDITSKKCQQLKEEKGEVGRVAAGGAGEG
ncbi:uncharacterized protein F5147DRAFT_771620 [Suillus discolor]|uniref:Uncharacterized protein n=1 Tax=Suillus discolor TaxID=1912936 RepID=A0A9P7FAJ0_9AGAM|nr:uncharacterized protein F5147DRAFT_771620 [Suillus discolor]KAG2112058.1 hypothetical protein F5147DRAFT_771620 [Suillus discolor]